MKKNLLKLMLLSSVVANSLFASGQYYYEPKKRFKDPYFDIFLGLEKQKDLDLGVNTGIISEKKYYLGTSDFSVGLSPYASFGYFSNEIDDETTENISVLNIGVAPSLNYDINPNWRLSTFASYNYIPYSNNNDSIDKLSSVSYGAGITYAQRNYDVKLSAGTIIPDLDNSDYSGNFYSVGTRLFLGENMFLYLDYKRTEIEDQSNNFYFLGVGFPFWN